MVYQRRVSSAAAAVGDVVPAAPGTGHMTMAVVNMIACTLKELVNMIVCTRTEVVTAIAYMNQETAGTARTTRIEDMMRAIAATETVTATASSEKTATARTAVAAPEASYPA